MESNLDVSGVGSFATTLLSDMASGEGGSMK